MDINDFPVAGITREIFVSVGELPLVLSRLTTCHPHVFLVDQSQSDKVVRLGLSETGARCAEEVLKGGAQ